MSTTKSIEGLLEKPVYIMTGEEYLELTFIAIFVILAYYYAKAKFT